MKSPINLNTKGLTLIELVVTLIISGIVIAGVYRIFVAQSKAFSVQDQVVEVQQNVRSAVELVLRDLRMAGYDDYSANSTVHGYESCCLSCFQQFHLGELRVLWHRNRPIPTAHSSLLEWCGIFDLDRELTVNEVSRPQEILLENVDAFELTYGLDADGDGGMDDRNANNVIDGGDWVSAGGVGQQRWLPFGWT